MDKVVLAFSGGLDTTFCVLWLRETLDAEVVTVTVDTGGFGNEELRDIEARTRALGIDDHRVVYAKSVVFDRFVSWLIKGDCLRGGAYPVSDGAERTTQAETVVEVAREVGASAIAHGSTRAGDDQIRFDVAIRALAPNGEVRVELFTGAIRVVGTRSPYSLMDADVGTYGESASGWTGKEVTGVAALRDPLNMADHGAVTTLSFVDCGHSSTAGIEDVSPIARTLLRSIDSAAGRELDVVVAEMGDGIIGCYGVETILTDATFRGLIRAHVYCANDLVAAWGGVEWLRARDLPGSLVAGPATDDQVGMRFIRDSMGLEAANARTDSERFEDLIEEAAFSRNAP